MTDPSRVRVTGPPTPSAPGPIDELLHRFRRYLIVERGLRDKGATDYARAVRPFLEGRLSQGALGLDRLSAADVTAFVVASCPRLSPGTVKLTMTALRSLLGFLHLEGTIERPLAAAVPSIASWRLAGLPKRLEPSQVRSLLASCDLNTAKGRRDFAILTMLVRLGLRAGEIAALRFEDIDWRAGEIVVRGKGRREERLPLPADVGEAIAAYLRGGRPENARGRNCLRDRPCPAPRDERRRRLGGRRERRLPVRARPHPRPPPSPYRRERDAARRRLARGGRAAAAPPARDDDGDLRQGRSRSAAKGRPSLAGDRSMSPLRVALADYLTVRRTLGYKLERAEKLLGQFIAYLEERGAKTITAEHALGWATLPAGGASLARAADVGGAGLRRPPADDRPRLRGAARGAPAGSSA